MALRIDVTNILLTRRCNLGCPQCRISKNYPNSPYVLPTKELDANAWVEFIENLDAKFHTIYGGEPMLYPQINELVSLLNRKGILYTLISNGTLLDKLRVVPYGLSLSCDGFWLGMDEMNKARSISAYKLLPEWKKRGVVDAVAVFTMNAFNYLSVFFTVSYFSLHRVVTEVTLLDQPKNEWYDLAEGWKEGNLQNIPKCEFDWVMDKLAEMKRNDYLIHNNFPFFELAKVYGYSDNYVCKEPWRILSVDCDGSLRLCYRIKGKRTPQLTVKDLDREEAVKFAMLSDKEELCRGCNWNCIMMAETDADFVYHGLRRELWYG
jgi:MoaA/NifB/PqqE/SkfB family radical SAM enzyme